MCGVKGQRFMVYSKKIIFVGSRKCPYDHERTNKVYLNDITLISISQFYPQNGGENQLA